MHSFRSFIKKNQLPIGFMSIKNSANAAHAQDLRHIDYILDSYNKGALLEQEALPDFKHPESYEYKHGHDMYRPEAARDFRVNRNLSREEYGQLGEYFPRDQYSEEPSHIPNLTDKEELSIRRYTLDSGGLNRALVSAHHLGKEIEPHHQEINQHLLSVAARSKTPHDLIVWSGVGRANPGRHRHMLLPAWSSTTLDVGTSRTFARHDMTLPMHDQHSLLRTIDKEGKGSVHMLQPHEAKAWHELNGNAFDYRLHSPEVRETLNSIARKYGHYGEHHEGIDSELSYDRVGAKTKPMSHVLKIHLPKGSHVVYPGHLSEHQGETELIAPPKSTIKLREKEPVTVDHSGRVYWPVDMETPRLK